MGVRAQEASFLPSLAYRCTPIKTLSTVAGSVICESERIMHSSSPSSHL